MNQTVRETKILEEKNITNAFLKKDHGTYLFSTFSFVPMTMEKTLQKGRGEQKYHVNLLPCKLISPIFSDLLEGHLQ